MKHCVKRCLCNLIYNLSLFTTSVPYISMLTQTPPSPLHSSFRTKLCDFLPLVSFVLKYICFMFLISLKVKHNLFSMLLLLCDSLPLGPVLLRVHMFYVLIFLKVKHSVFSMSPLSLVCKHTKGNVSGLY